MRSGAALLLVAWVLGAGNAAAESRSLRPWMDGPKPSFALTDLSGQLNDLERLRGRAVLVHFFATWCEPCIPELTALRALMERSADRPLALVAIDVGEIEDRVQRFFERLPVNFPVLLDRDRAVTKAWKVYALPTTYLLNRDLQPRYVVEGDADWNSAAIRAIIDKVITGDVEQ